MRVGNRKNLSLLLYLSVVNEVTMGVHLAISILVCPALWICGTYMYLVRYRHIFIYVYLCYTNLYQPCGVIRGSINIFTLTLILIGANIYLNPTGSGDSQGIKRPKSLNGES